MAFEVYLQVFRNGQEAGFDPAQVRAVLGRFLIEVQPGHWQVRFGAAESSDLFLSAASEDASLIHCISVHRPGKDARLWDALFALLSVPGSIFYFPGCPVPLARDPCVEESLPDDLLQDLGRPQFAQSAAELYLLVQSS